MQEEIQGLNSQTWDFIKEKGLELIMDFGPKLLIALIILIVGWKLISILKNGLNKVFIKRDLDPSLRPFFISIVSVGLKVLLILSVVGTVGIPMTSFIALIGAAGLAIGMAFSGTLSNVAGGIILLIIRPFKVGDYIATQGYEGTVKSILIFNTILTTVDNKVVIIPNGALATGNIINYSAMEDRRLDIVVNVEHGVDIMPIQENFLKIIKGDKRIFSDPEPKTIISISDTSVVITIRFWVKGSDYWDVNGVMHEKVYNYLRDNNIGIPYQKVNLLNNK